MLLDTCFTDVIYSIVMRFYCSLKKKLTNQRAVLIYVSVRLIFISGHETCLARYNRCLSRPGVNMTISIIYSGPMFGCGLKINILMRFHTYMYTYVSLVRYSYIENPFSGISKYLCSDLFKLMGLAYSCGSLIQMEPQ